MSPLDLLIWVGVISGSAVLVAVAAAIVVGCVKAITAKPTGSVTNQHPATLHAVAPTHAGRAVAQRLEDYARRRGDS